MPLTKDAIKYYGGFSLICGDIFSTAETVEYCARISSILWRDTINTVGHTIQSVEDVHCVGCHQYCGKYHQYCRGCSVLCRDIINIVRGYHQYCGGSWVLCKDIIITVEEYHQYCGGSGVLWRETRYNLHNWMLFPIQVERWLYRNCLENQETHPAVEVRLCCGHPETIRVVRWLNLKISKLSDLKLESKNIKLIGFERLRTVLSFLCPNLDVEMVLMGQQVC